MTVPNSTANASGDPAALAASVAHWWALAGVDVAVQDDPRDWLTPRPVPVALSRPEPIPSAPPTRSEPVPAAQPPIAQTAPTMPGDLDSFMTWLAAYRDHPESAFASTLVLPEMVIQPDVLIVTDMPTQKDMSAGKLFSGAEGQLIAAMLRAMGIKRERAALASLLMARPAGGVIDDGLATRATPRLAHLLGLAAPNAVILLGDRTSRALGTASGASAPLPIPALNPNDGRVSALSLPAPFVLLDHPERKAAAWAQLRHMAKR